MARFRSDGNEICIFARFVDDVKFTHNGVNGPESKTMRMFRRVHQVGPSGPKLLVNFMTL